MLGFMVAQLLTLAAGDTEPHYAFTTSIWGNGNLGSWQVVQGKGYVGLNAADKICQSQAAAAQLPNSGDFVAWLSDRDTDAYCHVLGLTGKRSANCAFAGMLPDAGPWFRTDGTPFASTLSTMTSGGSVLTPLLFDEFGERLTIHLESFTATNGDGVLNTVFDDFPDCKYWTSDSSDIHDAFAPLGFGSGTTIAWTDSNTAVSCNGTRRLICMQKGQGKALPSVADSGHRLAFVTASNVTGYLQGVAGADAICQSAAQAANLRDSLDFKALLTSALLGFRATDRFANDGAWYRLDGIRFASSLAQLVGGEVDAPLNVTEQGAYVGYAVPITGANDYGLPSGLDCNNWTSTSGTVDGSLANLVFFSPSGGHNWMSISEPQCSPQSVDDWPLKLYCLSDSDLLFYSTFGDSL